MFDPHEQGRTAYQSGETPEANPFKKMSREWLAWDDGWYEAQDEDLEDMADDD